MSRTPATPPPLTYEEAIGRRSRRDWAGPLDETVDFWQKRWKEACDRADSAESERDALFELRSSAPARITDEMLYRGLSAYYGIDYTETNWDDDRAEDFRRALVAACGVDFRRHRDVP